MEVLQATIPRLPEEADVQPFIFADQDNRDDQGVAQVKQQYLAKQGGVPGRPRPVPG